MTCTTNQVQTRMLQRTVSESMVQSQLVSVLMGEEQWARGYLSLAHTTMWQFLRLSLSGFRVCSPTPAHSFYYLSIICPSFHPFVNLSIHPSTYSYSVNQYCADIGVWKAHASPINLVHKKYRVWIINKVWLIIGNVNEVLII